MDEAMLVFRVSDTGIGMTEEQLGRLFQRFSQADESTTRKFGGTGLGLALTRAFSHLLGGDIAVASIHGEGNDLHAAFAGLHARATRLRGRHGRSRP